MDNNGQHISNANMTDHPDENAKARYADWLRGIAEKPDGVVMEHVANCEQCKSEILETASIMDELEKAGNARKRKTLMIVVRSVAALVTVIMMALIIQFLRPDSKQTELTGLSSENAIVPNDSNLIEDSLKETNPATDIIRQEITIIEHDTIKYAGNFVPDPALEVLIKAHLRSDSRINILLLPSDTVMISGQDWEIEFGRESGKSREAIMMSNRAVVLMDKHVEGKHFILHLDYDPGLYYLKFLSDKGLVWVGRIRVFSSLDETLHQ